MLCCFASLIHPDDAGRKKCPTCRHSSPSEALAQQLEAQQLEEVEPHFRSPEEEKKEEKEDDPLPFTGPGEYEEEEYDDGGEPDAFYVQEDDALAQRVNAVLSYQAARVPLVIGNPASLAEHLKALHLQRLAMYQEGEIMSIFRYVQVSFQCSGPLALLFLFTFLIFRRTRTAQMLCRLVFVTTLRIPMVCRRYSWPSRRWTTSRS